MRISDWSSDVCSSDLRTLITKNEAFLPRRIDFGGQFVGEAVVVRAVIKDRRGIDVEHLKDLDRLVPSKQSVVFVPDAEAIEIGAQRILVRGGIRSEEHTAELQSLMGNTYAVSCLK